MPLSNDEVESLLKMISIELAENQTLETIANTYHSMLPTADQFQVGSALAFSLQHLQEFEQIGVRRLVACFLLYECYKNQPIHLNPFAMLLFQLFNSLSTSSEQKGISKEMVEREKNFLKVLLLEKAPKKDLIKLTPKQILTTDSISTMLLEPLKNKLGEKNIKIDNSQFEKMLPERCKKAAIPTILPNPNEKSHETKDSPESIQQMLKELFTSDHYPMEQYFIPKFEQLAPPAHMNTEGEMFFWFPGELDELEFLWDETNTDPKPESVQNNSEDEEDLASGTTSMKDLMEKAFQTTLTLHQQHFFVLQLIDNPKAANEAGLTPQNFPDLVEHNPLVAIEVLRGLMHSGEFTEYLTVLVNMEMSVHSMEVVKLLTAEVELPKDIIVSYLSNCMSTCEQMKEEYTQNRLVRLFCVFLQSLIKNKTIAVEDIAIEVQCFCIQFSSFKEASALYRFLKTQGDDPGSLSLDVNAKESTSSNSNQSSPSG